MRKIAKSYGGCISLILFEERMARKHDLQLWKCSCGSQFLTFYYALYHVEKRHPGDTVEKRVRLKKSIEKSKSKWKTFYEDMSDNIYETIESKSLKAGKLILDLEPREMMKNGENVWEQRNTSCLELSNVFNESQINKPKEPEKATEIVKKLESVLDEESSSTDTINVVPDANDTDMDMDISEDELTPEDPESQTRQQKTDSPEDPEVPDIPAAPMSSEAPDDPRSQCELDDIQKNIPPPIEPTVIEPEILQRDTANNLKTLPEVLLPKTNKNLSTINAMNMDNCATKRTENIEMLEIEENQMNFDMRKSPNVMEANDDADVQKIIESFPHLENNVQPKSSTSGSMFFTKPFSLRKSGYQFKPMNKLSGWDLDECMDEWTSNHNDGKGNVGDEQIPSSERDVNLEISLQDGRAFIETDYSTLPQPPGSHAAETSYSNFSDEFITKKAFPVLEGSPQPVPPPRFMPPVSNSPPLPKMITGLSGFRKSQIPDPAFYPYPDYTLQYPRALLFTPDGQPTFRQLHLWEGFYAHVQSVGRSPLAVREEWLQKYAKYRPSGYGRQFPV